jgi:serine protease inhibitor
MPWPFTRRSPPSLAQMPDDRSTSPDVRFAFRLFRELVRKDDVSNVFFSPSSVMLCLTLVHELASGETRQAMANALEIASLDVAQLAAEIERLKAAFRARTDAEVSFANSLWFGRHAQITDELAARLRGLYESELTTLDFASPDATPIINGWVNTKTKGRISRIVNQISPLSALVAVNAVYFKGNWVDPFQRQFTRDAPFTTAVGQTNPLPMMLQSGTYLYYEDERLQMAALPYKGNLSMYVVLPSQAVDGRQFPQTVTSGSWESWLTGAKRMEGTIQLPRFKVDYGGQLKTALTSLGMERTFDEHRAEFEPVQTDLPPIWIDQVIHRALAEVNEEGTEAAAVTAVVMRAGAAMKQKVPHRFTMIVNRPFLLVIRDEATKAILFMGWIGDPQ